MARIFNSLLPLVLVIGTIYVFRVPLTVFAYQTVSQYAPCKVSIPYMIERVDPRFDVSVADVSRAAQDAVEVWETAANRDLFHEISTGTPVIKIRLQYDLRQQTTETLKDLGEQISNSSEQYDDVKADYNAARAHYMQQKAAFDAEAAQFDRDATSYQQEVDTWNRRGGAPPDTAGRLNAKKYDLEKRQQQLQADQREVNQIADSVNTLARRLNMMAGDINETARTYNKVGAQTGEEFEEGVFESRAGEESITVYEFDSQKRLTRLLAHEFGHALGMDHVEGQTSIMYRLNQSSNSSPTSDDIEALIARCKL
jgi:predicted Zn-dependent protease